MGAKLACATGRVKTDLAHGTVAARRSIASSGCAMVEAKKSAEAFAGDDVAGAAGFLGVDQLVPDALVIPFAMEMDEVLVKDVSQVALAEQDHT
ncbi:MAG: hypothetical protein GY722_06700, partial [bacterium]|nr:hypothetical protein [bacterium]